MSNVVLYAGDFGRAVANRLCEWQPCLRQISLYADADELHAAIYSAGHVAAAMWRPCIAQCQRVDTLVHAAQVSWSFVEVSGVTLACSHVIVPGSGRGCYHCYRARTDAHRRESDRQRVLRQAYALDPRLGPAGYTPAMVAIAVASLRVGLEASADVRLPFRQVDVLSGNVLESEIVALHDCPRCRPEIRDEDPTRRYLSTLAEELKELLA
ncbi:hypothetical protein [Xanthomonas sp. MUS 060]|uniref:hypothetical protein n=1 Tax=Xanthomonas sp. MUS 060 TaxID=1588031 RepID=UPI0005F2B729|nr:hypothetical protein [Xanthomonas sp. MUS 060]